MYIGNLPEDTTPSSQGYVVYSEDGVHLSKMKKEDFIKGIGKGTGMMYWDEGDGETVMDGTKIVYPRQVKGSLYSYGTEDGDAYWTALYPPTYWGGMYTGSEERNVIEICKDVGEGKEEIFAISNRGAIRMKSFDIGTVNAKQYYYIMENGDLVSLDDFFMRKYVIGLGLNTRTVQGETHLFSTGVRRLVGGYVESPYVSEVTDDGDLILNTYGGVKCMNDGIGNVMLGFVGNIAEHALYRAGSVPIIYQTLFSKDSNGTFQSLSTTYGMDSANSADFDIDFIYYYDGDEDVTTTADSTKVYSSHREIDINSMYGLSLNDGPVYLVGTYKANGYFNLDSTFLTQTLPSTQDGKIYIFLGNMKDDILDFQSTRKKYWYVDGAIREYAYAVLPPTMATDFVVKNGASTTSIVSSNGSVNLEIGSGIMSTTSTDQSGNIWLNLSASSGVSNLPYIPMNGTSSITNTDYKELTGLSGGPNYVYLLDIRVIIPNPVVGTRYEAMLAITESSGQAVSSSMLPYDRGTQGGYFKDTAVASSSTEPVVLAMSGFFRNNSYYIPSGEHICLAVKQDTAATTSVNYILNATQINTYGASN